MVERLKTAISKARANRAPVPGQVASAAPAAHGAAPAYQPAPQAADDLWARLRPFDPDTALMDSERIVAHQKRHQGHRAFDLLRTRLSRMLRDRGWSRVAITSPSKGCGKTVVCVNLALSLARLPGRRTVLIDMDLKAPRVASCLGVKRGDEAFRLRRFLDGRIPAEDYLVRLGEGLAVGFNSRPVSDSAELIASPTTAAVLADTRARLAPDITLYDLPPLMVNDDALALMPELDGVLLVAAAGETRPREIEECERLLADTAPLLGVLLNKYTARELEPYYGYGYGYGYGDERRDEGD